MTKNPYKDLDPVVVSRGLLEHHQDAIEFYRIRPSEPTDWAPVFACEVGAFLSRRIEYFLPVLEPAETLGLRPLDYLTTPNRKIPRSKRHLRKRLFAAAISSGAIVMSADAQATGPTSWTLRGGTVQVFAESHAVTVTAMCAGISGPPRQVAQSVVPDGTDTRALVLATLRSPEGVGADRAIEDGPGRLAAYLTRSVPHVVVDVDAPVSAAEAAALLTAKDDPDVEVLGEVTAQVREFAADRQREREQDWERRHAAEDEMHAKDHGVRRARARAAEIIRNTGAGAH